jgi:hypothetical protein
MFRICLESPFGSAKKTASFIFIDEACRSAKSKNICDKIREMRGTIMQAPHFPAFES